MSLILMGRRRGSGAVVPALASLPTLASLNRAAPNYATNSTIRALAAGATYTDDLSGVTVIKMTSATGPVANNGAGLPYSEGGPFISRAWGNRQHTVMSTLDRTTGGITYCFQDISRTGGSTGRVSAPRYRAWGNDELCCAFSMHTSTPKRCYVLSGSRLFAFDADDPTTNLNLTHIPSAGRDFSSVMGGGTILNWLSVTENDEWLTFQCQSTNIAIAFSPSTGTTRTVTMPGGYTLNQLHPEKSSGSTRVYLLANQYKVTVVWDHATGTTTTNTNLYGGHPAPWTGGFVEWNPDRDGVNGFTYNAATNTVTTVVNETAINSWFGIHKSLHWLNGTPPTSTYFLNTPEDPVVAVTSGPFLSIFGRGAWSVHSGQIYRATITTSGVLGGVVDTIGRLQAIQGPAGTTVPTRFDHRLLEVASVGAMTEGTTYYDTATKTLYVWCVGGGDPTTRLMVHIPYGNTLGLALHRGDGGDARLICAHRSHTNAPDNYQYAANAFGSLSPDGFVAGFSSNMGDATGRVDMYVALLPEA